MTDPRMQDWIEADWPAPRHVRTLMTTRNGGLSTGAWRGAHGGGMNLGLNSGDDPAVVAHNRALLAPLLPSAPAWLRQVHGVTVVDAASVSAAPEADAAFTTSPEVVCAVLVADCMPVLFTDRAGTRVAAAHAGWRGLAGGVLEATLDASGLDPAETLAWIGPAIGPTRFEIGDEVRDTLLDRQPDAIDACFRPRSAGKWWADLPALARARLAARGVATVVASDLCTASDRARFYSYRRDGVTGRMAALIWIDQRSSSD